MFSTLNPKERTGYAIATVAFLGGFALLGLQKLKPNTEITIDPGRPVSQRASTPNTLLGQAEESSTQDENVGKIAVHIVGAVNRPGLYEFDINHRVSDAIARAGGSKSSADLDSLNLAAKLVDGSQLMVPNKEATESSAALMDSNYSPVESRKKYSNSKTSSTKSSGLPSPASISLNTASKSELDRLPGVGPATAQKILEYRAQSGGFSSIDEILSVKGIGPKKLAAMRKYLRL